MKKAFTFIELLIVVAVLGILAAIVLPEFREYSQKAKESNAKANLRILRNAIERYAVRHNGVAPGYVDDDSTIAPTGLITKFHLEDGYLLEVPENQINGLSTIWAISNGAAFPASPDNTTGWLYKPSTKEIKLNSPGNDSEGVSYFSY